MIEYFGTQESWKFSSAGRASPLHGGGQGFESLNFHHRVQYHTGITWAVSETVKRGRL